MFFNSSLLHNTVSQPCEEALEFAYKVNLIDMRLQRQI